MNQRSRVENSLKNSLFGVFSQATNILLGLVVRTFFIHFLSKEYLGINGLFTNILTMMSLAEMGIGSAIVFSMYKPIAENDYRQIAKLMNFYKRAYEIIGIVVAGVGLCIVPFLKYIIKDQPNIDNLTIIYLLYLSNTVLSYFVAYKQSIFNADQRVRVIHSFRLVFYIVRSILQIIILIFLRNFVLYLLVQVICTFLENLAISLYADHKYSFLREYRMEKLTSEERKPIIKNIKALFIYKIGSTALDGTDNIIISAFDGIISVGLLSNYSLITNSVQMLLSQVTNSLTGSVGNFIAQEKEERYEELLDRITFLYFVLYGGSCVILMACLSTFVKIWAGESFVLSFWIVFIHCINMYIYGMMNAVWTFRSTMGLFVHGKWRPLISAVINIVVSIVLAQKIGLLGVILGTTITRITTNVWYDPYIVFKYGLKKKPVKYYLKWIGYLFVICTLVLLMHLFNMYINTTSILQLILSAFVAIVSFSTIVIILFGRSSEYKYYKSIIINFLKKNKK